MRGFIHPPRRDRSLIPKPGQPVFHNAAQHSHQALRASVGGLRANPGRGSDLGALSKRACRRSCPFDCKGASVRDMIFSSWLYGNHAVTAAVLGLFWAALSRPNRVHWRAAFRLSALLVGASVVANVVVTLLLIFCVPEDDGRGRQHPSDWLFLLVVPPVILMLAIYLGVASVMEGRARRDASPGGTTSTDLA